MTESINLGHVFEQICALHSLGLLTMHAMKLRTYVSTVSNSHVPEQCVPLRV